MSRRVKKTRRRTAFERNELLQDLRAVADDPMSHSFVFMKMVGNGLAPMPNDFWRTGIMVEQNTPGFATKQVTLQLVLSYAHCTDDYPPKNTTWQLDRMTCRTLYARLMRVAKAFCVLTSHARKQKRIIVEQAEQIARLKARLRKHRKTTT